MADTPCVAVTGASGYIALHVIRDLLAQGYAVRGTLRDPARGATLRQGLEQEIDVSRLDFVAADLTADAGWDQAVSGCSHVMHVASPLPLAPPKREDDLIVPARDGALRVLRAAAHAGVSRVVMTSSIAAVASGRDEGRRFTEDDWSDLDKPIGAYAKSKTVAERAAWELIDSLPAGSRPELVTINPGLVIGPLIDPDGSASVEVVRKLLAREVPGCPQLGYALVDVRDVAEAHVRAMTSPLAAGKRYICTGGFTWMAELARILQDHVGGRGYKVPQRQLPNWLVRLVAVFDPTVRLVVDDLGRRVEFDTSRIATDLDWKPHAIEASVIDTADSLIGHGVV